RPALYRQGGRERRSGRAGVEQERYAHHGGNSHRARARSIRNIVGAMERAHPPDPALADRAGGARVLRRLLENHPPGQPAHRVALETLIGVCSGVVHLVLSLVLARVLTSSIFSVVE